MEAEISRLRLQTPRGKAVKLLYLDRVLDELSDGLDGLTPLPADFSRADLYAEHD